MTAAPKKPLSREAMYNDHSCAADHREDDHAVREEPGRLQGGDRRHQAGDRRGDRGAVQRQGHCR